MNAARARDPRLDHLQRTLEEGLREIAAARTPREAAAARHRARARLESLSYRHRTVPSGDAEPTDDS